MRNANEVLWDDAEARTRNPEPKILYDQHAEELHPELWLDEAAESEGQ